MKRWVKIIYNWKGRCNVTSSKDISEFFDYIPTNPYFYIVLYILLQMKILLNFLMIEILN